MIVDLQFVALRLAVDDVLHDHREVEEHRDDHQRHDREHELERQVVLELARQVRGAGLAAVERDGPGRGAPHQHADDQGGDRGPGPQRAHVRGLGRDADRPAEAEDLLHRAPGGGHRHDDGGRSQSQDPACAPGAGPGRRPISAHCCCLPPRTVHALRPGAEDGSGRCGERPGDPGPDVGAETIRASHYALSEGRAGCHGAAHPGRHTERIPPVGAAAVAPEPEVSADACAA